jgi:hypothetical protein
MAGKESNPIQQRMELLVEKWEAVAKNPEVSVVRILAKENEKEMVDAFYSYLLGVDTDNHDVPVIFNSIYHDGRQYAEALLTELDDMIETWNCASKENVEVAIPHLDWHPNFQLTSDGNPAALFIRNINALAEYLPLQDGVFLVTILRVSFVEPGPVNNWLNQAIKAGIHDKVKLVVDDTEARPFYQNLAGRNPGTVATLIPGLDMDNALQQLAAMGKPDDSGVQYRKAFLAMMQAIEKRKETEAEKHAASCIQIAEKNLPANPYWIGQVIAVNAALANDQVGYKNFRKAIRYASQGVEAAEKSKELITDDFVYRKFLGQAVMLRASLYAAAKDWLHAAEDFTLAAGHYVYTNDTMLAMEACRMLGVSWYKAGNRDAACKALVEAMLIGEQIPPHLIKFTTFAGVIELLFKINNLNYISNEEIEEAAYSAFGENWAEEIRNWKKPHYEPVNDPAKAMM